MKKGNHKKAILCVSGIMLVIVVFGICFFLYQMIHGVENQLKIKLKGKNTVIVMVSNPYKDNGSVAFYGKKDLSKTIKVKGKVDTNKIGIYQLKYIIQYKKLVKTITRTVKVVDKILPEIQLSGDEVSIIIGNDYHEPGYVASDNYDGDLTDKVKVTNNINKDQLGEYQVIYEVLDSSQNKAIKTRKVNVIAKPSVASGGQGIAVLNYHFFYDQSRGETCNESICEEISQFKSHLKWLNDNGYKTLTMKEFRDWMYGYTELPEKSVLITIDDGAMGTGKHNGYTLIPALEEYNAHATLFLITGWWDIRNYQGSKYLEIESHTNDMHNEGWCSGVTRGAKMLCQDNETVKADLLRSIEITNSKMAFCFPFYAYDQKSLNIVKEVGFELAFVGGSRKAKRSDNKWLIPRYPVMNYHTLDNIIQMVS